MQNEQVGDVDPVFLLNTFHELEFNFDRVAMKGQSQALA